jgi:hypothetical protein
VGFGGVNGVLGEAWCGEGEGRVKEMAKAKRVRMGVCKSVWVKGGSGGDGSVKGTLAACSQGALVKAAKAVEAWCGWWKAK